jgi:hypothetical protein
MEALISQECHSWAMDSSPMVLGDIFSPEHSVAIWQRSIDSDISHYFANCFDDLGLGIRGVFTIENLKVELAKLLPNHSYKERALEDVFLLSDMLTCLFGCDSVGLRIAPLSKAMCPKLHTDNIPVRLVSTYLGPGTQWLPLEVLEEEQLAPADTKSLGQYKGRYYQESHIQQLNSFDVALLKGSAWENQEHMAAVHRSCPISENDKRVLLSLDPM